MKALYTIAEIRNNPNVHRQMNKDVTHTEYYSAVKKKKKNETMPSAAAGRT